MAEDEEDGYSGLYDGFRPNWVEYTALEGALLPLQKMIGSSLVDVQGALADAGWIADWVLVLSFTSGSVSVLTKCDWYWAIDEWKDYCFIPPEVDDDAFGNTRHTSLVTPLKLEPLVGKELRDIRILPGEPHEFLLDFGSQILVIEDAGDRLGLSLLERDRAAVVLQRSRPLNSFDA